MKIKFLMEDTNNISLKKIRSKAELRRAIDRSISLGRKNLKNEDIVEKLMEVYGKEVDYIALVDYVSNIVHEIGRIYPEDAPIVDKDEVVDAIMEEIEDGMTDIWEVRYENRTLNYIAVEKY